MPGIIQSRTLGKMGRWGNAIFQYLFLRTYARRHDLDIRAPYWLGESIFGFQHDRPERSLPLTREQMIHGIDDTVIPHLKAPLRDAEVEGYFQYHTSWHAPDREFLVDLFARPVNSVMQRVGPAIYQLRNLAPKVIGLHVRRGDFGQSFFYLTPIEWYLELLDRVYDQDTAVFVASDDPSVVEAFAKYRPITAAMLGVTLSSDAPAGVAHLHKDLNDRNPTPLDFFPDWELLRHCDALAIGNSTFSFSAAMLSHRLKALYRSDPDARRFEQIDPWDSFPSQFIDPKKYRHIPGLFLKENAYW